VSHRFRHVLPLGCDYRDGQARFRLWAPACDTVAVEFEDGRSIPMQPQDSFGCQGWFEIDTACAPGEGYRYRISPDLAVPDPASRAQRDDVHGYSIVVDACAFAWQNGDWQGRPWTEMVIYELHPGTFGAAGAGGFRGIQERLQHLVDLGVTAIELMPIADFPGQRNWGYDGVLTYAPDAAYGSPEDLKALIDAAHGLGLCVYLDVVYNHFGPDGNYLHAYAPTFFDPDQHSPWGAAIDFHLGAVRQFFTENALYWLMEYRFDGLRFDAVHAICDPGWLDEMAARVRATVEPGRQVHLVLENEHNQASHLSGDFDAQWNDDAHNVLHVMLTGEQEGYYQNYPDPPRQLARCLGEGFIYQGDPSPSHDGKPRGTSSAHLPPTKFVSFLQNHDQIGNRAMGERLTTLADPDALRAAVLLHLLCPQIPLLFMGEEWGSTQPFLFFTDFHDELADAVREGRRREFKQFASFQDPEQRARIPDPNAVDTFTRSIPDFSRLIGDETADATLAYYRRLLAIRAREIAPRLPGSRSAGVQVTGDRALVADWTLGDGSTLSIRLNFSDAPCGAPRPLGVLLASSSDIAAVDDAGGLIAPCSASAYLFDPTTFEADPA